MEIKEPSDDDFIEEPFEVSALNDYGRGVVEVFLTVDGDEGKVFKYDHGNKIYNHFLCIGGIFPLTFAIVVAVILLIAAVAAAIFVKKGIIFGSKLKNPLNYHFSNGNSF